MMEQLESRVGIVLSGRAVPRKALGHFLRGVEFVDFL